MATTGVPNQLYQGTDAPDLVEGAFAKHTHEVEITLQTVKKTTNNLPLIEGGKGSVTELTFPIPEGKSFVGIRSITTSATEYIAISSFSAQVAVSDVSLYIYYHNYRDQKVDKNYTISASAVFI